MALFENFPYSNLHDLNLGWILKKVSEAYSPENPPEAMVISVNGESGEVILYKDAIIKFPDVVDTQWNMWRNSDGTATGIQFEKDQPMKRINGNSRFVIYDAGNPPPYPVVSVNGETGAIELYTEAYVEFPSLEDDNWGLQRKLNSGTADEVTVGIMFDDTGKAKIIKDEDSNDIYSENNPPPYPVLSVDGNTGTVNTWANTSTPVTKLPNSSNTDDWTIARDIDSGMVGIKLAYDSNIDSLTAYVVFDDGVNTPTPIKLLTLNDIPSTSGVLSVNNKSGIVTLYSDEIYISSQSNQTIAQAITDILGAISTINGDINTIETSISNMNTTMSGNINRIDGDITRIDGDITTINSDITTINGEIGNINSELISAETDIQTNASNITSIQDQLATISSYVVYAPTYCYAQKKLGIVCVYGHSGGGLTLNGDGQWHQLTTLPTGFRPTTEVYCAGATADGRGISFHIDTSGVVEYVLNSNTSYWNFGAFFIT